MSLFAVIRLLFFLFCAFMTSLVITVSAAPSKRFEHSQNSHSAWSSLVDISDYSLPLSNGVQSLPPPSAGLTLKYICIARGVWNYTCATSTSDSIPSSIGAITTLFDAAELVQDISEFQFHQIPSAIVNISLAVVENSKLDDLVQPVVLGTLFFPAQHSPIFDLRPKAYFIGSLTAQIPAPSDSGAGPNGESAVPWYKLVAQPGSYGVQEFYRVYTAGGSAPATCAGQPPLAQRQYSSEVWWYG